MNPDDGKPGLLDWAERIGRTAENAFLLTLLTAMLVLGASQIVLRNFLGSGLAWGDEALRIMVLWLALIGAVAASRDDRHISIDVASRILPPRARALVAAVVNLFTAGVCAALAWYAWEFVADSRAYEDQLLVVQERSMVQQGRVLAAALGGRGALDAEEAVEHMAEGHAMMGDAHT